MAKKKIYLVETQSGEYRRFLDWPSCQAFVQGKPYWFAGGETESEAKTRIMQAKAKRTSGSAKPKKTKKVPLVSNKPTVGICSDAGTHGNPGPSEYQVTDLSGNLLSHKHLGVHTNNYAELAGIGAMIQYAIAHHHQKLYTDSKIAMIWIKKNQLGPTVHEADQILAMIGKIRMLLQANPQLELLKWDTRKWGQIPADFGRK